MIRKIIHIDQNKCTGCGLCAKACHEGAIDMVDGKARLMREHYCDGLGDCLPACPAGAISFEEREAAEYSEEAVQQKKSEKHEETLPCGCPGTQSKRIVHVERHSPAAAGNQLRTARCANAAHCAPWPHPLPRPRRPIAAPRRPATRVGWRCC